MAAPAVLVVGGVLQFFEGAVPVAKKARAVLYLVSVLLSVPLVRGPWTDWERPPRPRPGGPSASEPPLQSRAPKHGR